MQRFTVFALRLLAILALALSAFALGAGSSPSDAQTASCPDGTILAADGTCISEAVNDNVTTTTSCTTGVLSDDGQSCLVPRLDAPTSPTPPAAPAATSGDIAAPIPNFTG